MVIRYADLWRDGHERGLEEGAKDRPCAILLSVTDDAGERKITFLPVTHTPPNDPAHAVEILAGTQRRLGLDERRSWIIVTEANRFAWPGPDLRPTRAADTTSVVYGELSGNLFRAVKEKWLACAARQRSLVTRTE